MSAVEGMIDESILQQIAEERAAYDWRGKTTWDGDTRPAEHVERCKEYARWYISRYLSALQEPAVDKDTESAICEKIVNVLRYAYDTGSDSYNADLFNAHSIVNAIRPYLSQPELTAVTASMIQAAYLAEFRHHHPNKEMTEMCWQGTPLMVIKKMIEAALNAASFSQLQSQLEVSENEAIEVADNEIAAYCSKYDGVPDCEEIVRLTIEALHAAGMKIVRGGE